MGKEWIKGKFGMGKESAEGETVNREAVNEEEIGNGNESVKGKLVRI